MKAYIVTGAVQAVDFPLPMNVFLGIYLTREEALAALKAEWERVEYLIEEGEKVEPDVRTRLDDEWSKIELPLVIADENVYDIREVEVPDGSIS